MKRLDIPTDEKEEATRREELAEILSIAYNHVVMSDERTIEDSRNEDSDGAYYESVLCIDWVKEWQRLKARQESYST